MSNGWYTVETCYPADVTATVAAFAGDGELAWLDSPVTSPENAPSGRYSLIAGPPIAVIEQFDREPATLRVAGREHDRDADGWALWRRTHARLPRLPTATAGLSPGWLGYVGFEMARRLETLPATRHEDLGLPLMRLGLATHAVVLDHDERRACVVGAAQASETLGVDAARECDAHRARWEAAAAGLAWLNAGRVAPVHAVRLEHELRQADYEAAVRQALRYIAAGDIYQVNLCQRLRMTGMPAALSAFAAMRHGNPAAYSALLRWGRRAVLSASPELFLRVEDGRALTRPIKGTRPCVDDVALDEVRRAELLASEKDRAELTMIVDLHRNDLGRVCRPGTVRVVEPRGLERHPSVFHTVADVVGTLAEGRDALDLLMACFPAGSITGAPKIRAMEIIDELEPVARGAYSGAVGVLGLDGRMTFNVAIRTLQQHGDVANLYVGGGIVADSDPTDEYEETLAKARGILRALGLDEAVGWNCSGDGRRSLNYEV